MIRRQQKNVSRMSRETRERKTKAKTRSNKNDNYNKTKTKTKEISLPLMDAAINEGVRNKQMDVIENQKPAMTEPMTSKQKNTTMKQTRQR